MLAELVAAEQSPDFDLDELVREFPRAPFDTDDIQSLISLLCGKIWPRYYVLMNSDRSVHLAAPPKQAAQGEVSFDRLVVDPDHAQEMLECLVGLLVQQKVQTFEVVNVKRWRRLLGISFAETSHRPSSQGEQQEKTRK